MERIPRHERDHHRATNIAYEEKERRGFFKLNLIALGLTLGLLVGGIIVITLIGVLPAAAQFLAIGVGTKWLLLLVQWPLLVVLMMFGLAVLYRYAPDRDKPQWRWVSAGRNRCDHSVDHRLDRVHRVRCQLQ